MLPDFLERKQIDPWKYRYAWKEANLTASPPKSSHSQVCKQLANKQDIIIALGLPYWVTHKHN